MKRHTENNKKWSFSTFLYSCDKLADKKQRAFAWWPEHLRSYTDVSLNRKASFPFHLAVLSLRLAHWRTAALVQYRNKEQQWWTQITVQSQLFRQHEFAPGPRETNLRQARRNDCWQTWMHNKKWGNITQHDDQKGRHVSSQMFL